MGAQSRLRRKPVQSATTCLTSVYFSGAGAGAGAVAPLITARLADWGIRGNAETEPHRNLLRGSRAGRSRRPRRTSQLTVRLWSCRQGGRAKGFAQRDGLPEKCEKCCADTAFARSPISGYGFAISNGKCKGTHLSLAKG